MEHTSKLEKCSKLKQISGKIGLDERSTDDQTDNHDDKIKHDKAELINPSLSNMSLFISSQLQNGLSQATSSNQPFSKSDLSDIKMIDDTFEENHKSEIEINETQDIFNKSDETIENINLNDDNKVIESEEVNRLKFIRFNDKSKDEHASTSIPFDRSISASSIGKNIFSIVLYTNM